MAKSYWPDSAGILPSLSIRLPAVIGRGSKRNWPSECLRKLKAGEPLDYFNPDAPFNNVVHEHDIATLVAAALQQGLSGADMVIAGAAGRTTIAEVVRVLAEATGSASPRTAQTRARAAFLIDSGKASGYSASRQWTFWPPCANSWAITLNGDTLRVRAYGGFVNLERFH